MTDKPDKASEGNRTRAREKTESVSGLQATSREIAFNQKAKKRTRQRLFANSPPEV